MSISLFCKCGSVYDAEKLDAEKLYKCKECGSVLTPQNAVDPVALESEQEDAIPKSGLLISAILIVALAMLGVAVGAFKVNAKTIEAKAKYEDEVKSIAPQLEKWEKEAGSIQIVDESEEQAASFMNKVFNKITEARKNVYPAVVTVSCDSGTGSGVIFKPDNHGKRRDGYIVTNFHVVQGASIVEAILSNQENVAADIIFADDFCDIAVIKLRDSTKASDIKPAEFGDSDKIRVGEFCMAMGAPQGLGRSVSLGIVVGVNRYIPMMLGNHYAHMRHVFFQMDAPINHGNSGGPLVSIEGKVIGMNTLSWFEFQRVGYAIASNFESIIVNKIVSAREQGSTTFVNRSKFGLQFTTLSTFGMENRTGAPVSAVESDSPALEIGIRPGDIITKVRNTKTGVEKYVSIHSLSDLAEVNFLFEMQEFYTEFEVTWRNYITGVEKTAVMRSKSFPDREEPIKEMGEFFWGAYLERASEADLEFAGFSNEEEGGLVIRSWSDDTSRVESYSLYAINLQPLGFQRGDVILRVCGTKPTTHYHMRELLSEYYQRNLRMGSFPPAYFEVLRGSSKIFITLDLQ